MGKPSKTERMKQRMDQTPQVPDNGTEITKQIWDLTPKSHKRKWKDGTLHLLAKPTRKGAKPRWITVYWRR